MGWCKWERRSWEETTCCTVQSTTLLRPSYSAQVLNKVMETRDRPDAELYTAIIEGLWQSRSQPQRLRALSRFNVALQGNVHGLAASIPSGETALEVRPWPHTARSLLTCQCLTCSPVPASFWCGLSYYRTVGRLAHGCVQHPEYLPCSCSSPGVSQCHQVRADKHVLQIVVPTLTPGATMLALHYVLSNLQNTIRARHIALAPSGSAAYLGSSHCTPLLQTC